MAVTVGVLALQGDFARHIQSLQRLKIRTLPVRWPQDLGPCDGLILPGGESTTFVNLLEKTGLADAIRRFAEFRPVFGTCAGLITLATNIQNHTMETLGLIHLTVERNAYGRQVDSFTDTVRIPVLPDNPVYEGVFIRAPKIAAVGDGTEALGYHGNDIVMARNEHILVSTFHPELTRDLRVHQYFIETMIRSQIRQDSQDALLI